MVMRKSRFAIALLALLLVGAKASMAQSFNAGLIAGATFSQVDGDSYYGYHQLGWTAGAYVNLPVEEHFALQMELKYALLGAHSSTKEVVEYYYNPYNLRLHYAEIPLMLRYDFGHFTVNGRPLDFLSLEAGVGLDFRMKATEDVDTDYQVTTERWRFFSMTFNAGLHFALTDHLGLGARWMYSVVPCRINYESPSYLFGHYYNKVWQLTLTYNLNSPLR